MSSADLHNSDAAPASKKQSLIISIINSRMATRLLTCCLGLVLVVIAFGCSSTGAAGDYWRSAYAKEKAGNLDGAIADYSKSIKADPTFEMGYESRAYLREKMGDHDGAIGDCTKVIELDPKSTSAYATRMNALKAKGDLAGAASDQKKIAALMNEWVDSGNKNRSSAKHYTDGQEIPGGGTAIGDVYILPNGGCFGGVGQQSGIRWKSGSTMYFGDTISAQNPVSLVAPGSPATK